MVLVTAPTAASSVVSVARVAAGASGASGAGCSSGAAGGCSSGAVGGCSPGVVGGCCSSSHLSAGGSSALPLSYEVSPLLQWATARKVIFPVVPAARSKWSENWLWLGPKKWSSDSSSVTSPFSL